MTADRILPLAGHELRYRRLGGGYRREDVERVLAELQYTMRLLEGDLEALRARAAELENDVHDARAEAEAYRTRESELEQAVQAAGTMLERTRKLETAAFERNDGVVAAVDSLGKDLARLGQAVSELVLPATQSGPAGGTAPSAP